MPNPYFYLLSLLLGINISAYAQKYPIDTLDVVANAKIFFLSQDTSFYTYRGIINFLNVLFNYLQSCFIVMRLINLKWGYTS